MSERTRRVLGVVLAVLAVAVAAPATSALRQAATTVSPAQVDALFSEWSTSTPGCAVGVADDGRVVLERAYGMAELEHAVPNGTETIFEAGSVSKQFTAAAVLLLVQDGRLSLDDPVRAYVPELPDYGTPITIQHLLTHTSGLRDWGSLAGIAGWPRTSRVHTHAHVLDILSRQGALNFEPGTRWSYSNSGYNLSAILVSRVAGMSFAEFSRTRIFEPAGMTHTSWRDDFRRLVPHRASAYARRGDEYREDMPFENVHGNGGLLTTVGDLLRWNENFVTAAVGGPEFVALMQQPARLPDGRELHYAHGLFIGAYRGRREVYHSGSTAGYRAYLTRFPDEHLSVAVLCNDAGANATRLARQVVDLFLPEPAEPGLPDVSRLPEAAGPMAGVERDPDFAPDAAALAAYAGTYLSGEVETAVTLMVRDGQLVLHRRPDDEIVLRPHSQDRFQAGGGLGLLTFRRTGGRVTGFGITQDRVWDLRFVRIMGR